MENKGIVFFFPHSESRPVFIIYNDKLYKIKSGQIENVRIVKISSKFETYKKELINEILEKELNKEFGIFEYDKINKRFFLQLEKKTVKVKIGNETFNDDNRLLVIFSESLFNKLINDKNIISKYDIPVGATLGQIKESIGKAIKGGIHSLFPKDRKALKRFTSYKEVLTNKDIQHLINEINDIKNHSFAFANNSDYFNYKSIVNFYKMFGELLSRSSKNLDTYTVIYTELSNNNLYIDKLLPLLIIEKDFNKLLEAYRNIGINDIEYSIGLRGETLIDYFNNVIDTVQFTEAFGKRKYSSIEVEYKDNISKDKPIENLSDYILANNIKVKIGNTEDGKILLDMETYDLRLKNTIIELSEEGKKLRLLDGNIGIVSFYYDLLSEFSEIYFIKKNFVNYKNFLVKTFNSFKNNFDEVYKRVAIPQEYVENNKNFKNIKENLKSIIDILLKNVNDITSGVIGNSVKIIIENMFGEVC